MKLKWLWPFKVRASTATQTEEEIATEELFSSKKDGKTHGLEAESLALFQKKDEKALNNVSGVAYSGNPMRYNMWLYGYPTIIDLVGLKIPGNVPLLNDHSNTTEGRLGLVKASVGPKGRRLLYAGEISSESEKAKNIITQAKTHKWQNSVGVDVWEADLVEEGKHEINGRMVKAPFIHAKKSELREISVVSVGVDSSTSMSVAAKLDFQGDLNMRLNELFMRLRAKAGGGSEPEPEPEKTEVKAPGVEELEPTVPDIEVGRAHVVLDLPDDTPINTDIKAAIQSERKRVNEIDRLCAFQKEYIDTSEIRLKAINEDWTPEQTGLKILEDLKLTRPKPYQILSPAGPTGKEKSNVIEASFLMQCDVPIPEKQLLKDYGEKALDYATKQPVSLQRAFIECSIAEGKLNHYPNFDDSIIELGFSTTSLPGILNNVANKALLSGYESTPVYAKILCRRGNLNDFKPHERYRLNNMGSLQQMPPGGRMKHSYPGEEKATNQAHTYAQIIMLDRPTIINDDLDSFLQIPVMQGQQVGELEDDIFFTRLLSNPTMEDSVALFEAATHLNLATGLTTALDLDALKAANTLLRQQTRANGKPIVILPKYLVVPVELEWLANELVKADKIVVTGGDTIDGIVTALPEYNAMSRLGLEVVAPPHLSNSAYTGYSATAWYLWGDPRRYQTFELGYLKGRERPHTGTGQPAPDQLGMLWYVYHDVGIREQDWRAINKQTGAA